MDVTALILLGLIVVCLAIIACSLMVIVALIHESTKGIRAVVQYSDDQKVRDDELKRRWDNYIAGMEDEDDGK